MPKDYLLNAFFGLLLFCGIIFIMIWLLKKKGLSKGLGLNKSKYIKSLDRLILSNDKRLEIVEIGDTCYVLAVTQNSINVIDKWGKEALCEFETYEEKKNFSGLVNQFIQKNTK